MTDIYTKAKRSAIMSKVKNKRTQPEDRVAGLLDELAVDYERNVRTLPGQPDFVVGAKDTVVFVNGCFWHGHANCKRAKLPDTNSAFWRNKIATNKRRDRRNARLLRREGWHIITVWQCRLRRPKSVQSRLRRILGS